MWPVLLVILTKSGFSQKKKKRGENEKKFNSTKDLNLCTFLLCNVDFDKFQINF